MKQPSHPFLLLSLCLFAAILVSAFLGRYPTPSLMSIETFQNDPMAQRVVLILRLPRILAACLLGMALSASGLVMQMLFRNPLVEPGFLGVSQGAAFGAAFSIVFLGASGAWMQILAALFACVGLGFSYFLARRMRYGGWTLRLVLAGIAVSAFFSSANGLLKYVADPLTQLPEITFWLLGGLWGVTWEKITLVLPVVTAALIVLLLLRWRLNILSLDDETAFSLGTAPARERTLLLVAAVAATASVVSIAGVVGWIGLIVPHLARRILGADAQRALPGALLIGGLFGILCDDIGRTAFAAEIPIGILTSFMGALLFLLILTSRNAEVSK